MDSDINDMDSTNTETGLDGGQEDNDLKPLIKIDPNSRCIICCKLASDTSERGEGSKSIFEDTQKVEHESGCNGNISDAEVFRCMVKLLAVRLNKKLIPGESSNCEVSSNEEIPVFCVKCKEQIEMLNEVKRKIRELERTLHLGVLRLKETMRSSEEHFQNEEIYEQNEKYYYIRNKILGTNITGKRPQTTRAKLEQESEDVPDKDSDQAVRRSLRKSRGYRSSKGEREDVKDVDTFDDEERPGFESDATFSPGATEVTDFDEGSDYSDTPDEPSLRPSKKPKTATVGMRKKLDNRRDSKKRSKNTSGQQQRKRSKGSVKTHNSENKRRGSYCREKLKEDSTTGHCVYMDIKFEKLAPEKYKCTQCLEVVPNHSTIKKHVVRVHTDRYVCSKCGQHKASASDLNKHVREVHEGRARKAPEKTMECPICGKPFGHKTALEFHKITHYSEEDKKEAAAKGEKIPDYKDRVKLHQCGICGVVFNNITWLKKHEKIKHPKTEEERYEVQKICPECGKSFSEAYLKAHIERYHSNHDESVIKPFVCSFCEKRFYSSARLVQHKRTHTGERPFQCTICDKHFITKNRLKYHIMQNHENKKPFACTNCSAAFVTSYKLRRHIATVHEGKNQKDWNSKKTKEEIITPEIDPLNQSNVTANGSHHNMPTGFYF